MTNHLGIFGYPLSHSISPVFQQAALDHYSLPIRYEAWPTPPDRLCQAVRRLRQGEYLGANVTIPHKERVVGALDRTDRVAGRVGAVNTIAKEGSRLVGYNTDVDAFVASLKQDAGLDPRGSSVLLLGAGGAARAAAFGLADEQVGSLTIANRTLERARALADEVREHIGTTAAASIEEAALAELLPVVDLIVNATSIGMGRGAAAGRSPLRADLIPSDALVFDMVYSPTETPLLLEARRAGARAVGGLSMLVRQGAAGFELWTGRDAPIGVMLRAAEGAMAAQQSREPA